MHARQVNEIYELIAWEVGTAHVFFNSDPRIVRNLLAKAGQLIEKGGLP